MYNCWVPVSTKGYLSQWRKFMHFSKLNESCRKSTLLCGFIWEDYTPLGKWFSWFSKDSGLQRRKIALILLFLFNCRILVCDLQKSKEKGQNIDKFPDMIAMKTINPLTEKCLKCKMMGNIQWHSEKIVDAFTVFYAFLK